MPAVSGKAKSAAQLPATLCTVIVAAEVMKRYGISAERFLEGSGVVPADLGKPDVVITHAQEMAIFANALDATGNTGIGLEIGDAIPVTAYGWRGTAMLVSPTLEAAIRLANSYPLLAICYFRIDLEVDGDEARIVIRDYAYRADLLVLNSDMCIAVLRREMLGVLGGREIKFRRLQLAFPPPPHADRYAALFGCPVEFGAQESACYFPAAELASPLPLAHAHALEVARRHCDRQERELQKWTPSGVVESVLDHMYRNPGWKDYEQLYLSQRSLQRKLQLLGTSLGELRDIVRRDLASRYMSSERFSMKEIAAKLGFEQPRSLHRWIASERKLHVSDHALGGMPRTAATLKKRAVGI
ncbi:Transcriptional regulator, AraC family [Burkholderia singularis]|uniref:Transcriptional regulator, AraC family n=2 Tax=Burkholderia singularis TaxID=1503053 RepID=A0A238H214_9BURK|nr:Transcriptional regulator, AraC family [Burkholderia singularis]